MAGSKSIRIVGMEPRVFFVVALITLLGLYCEVLPNSMLAGFALCMVIGGLLDWLGDQIPVFNMFGGSAILCIATPALLVYWGLFPESGVEIISNFFSGYDFVDFLIAALITGSLLSMDRTILLKVGTRFAIPVVAGVACTFLVGGFVGSLTGFGFAESILFIVAPIMGGGIGAGAIPMSEIYASYAGTDSSNYLSQLVPAIMVANLFCIITAAILNGLGKKNRNLFKGFSGNGDMLRTQGKIEASETEDEKQDSATFSDLAIGMMVAATLFIFGLLIEAIIPAIHSYAWTIIAAALVKIFNLAPAAVQKSAGSWFGFVSKTWIPTILVAVSTSLIKIPEILQVLTNPAYLGITVLTVAIASLAAGIFGWLVGMYFVEGSITAGLCMADVGGSGDVAVLGTSERMHLMPFAQISSRLGGAFILVIMSFLVPLLM